MKTIAILLVLGLLALWTYRTFNAWKKNVEAAKRSGLPYVLSPIYLYNTFWMITNKLWIPWLRRLPTRWTDPWLDYMSPDWVWELGYPPFARHGDTFLTVAPGGTLLWTVEPEAISQICARREAFPKPLESYEILNVFGSNILGTEGQTWKAHRKITSPSFNEKNNVLVFEEAVNQSRQMLKQWTGPEGKGNFTLKDIAPDTMRATLHIICRVGFGVSLLWPGEKPKNEVEAASGFSSEELLDGHTMSFANSLSTLLERLLLVVLMPRWLLKCFPMKATREAYESFTEWGKYMNEIFQQKVEEAKAGKCNNAIGGMDIMGSLVKTSYGPDEEKAQVNKISLKDEEILGDMFIIVVAGHETTANAVHFALVQLALNPHTQRLLQKEIDSIFNGQDPTEWDYDECVNRLTGSIVGSVMNEILRVMPSVIVIPKRVTKNSPQHLTLAGKSHELPAGVTINLNAVGASRNPKYWPSGGPSKISGKTDDLDDFVPERWMVKNDDAESAHLSASEQTDSEDESNQGPRGPDTSTHLFRPVRGSYLPFSDGARSCLGRRFAQVEVLVILAVIFQKYSIELAVDEWASDGDVDKMKIGGPERKAVYEKARVSGREKLAGASSLLTLKLQHGSIPVRVVKRGEERFISSID